MKTKRPSRKRKAAPRQGLTARLKEHRDRTEADVLRLVGGTCRAHDEEIAGIQRHLQELEARIEKLEATTRANENAPK